MSKPSERNETALIPRRRSRSVWLLCLASVACSDAGVEPTEPEAQMSEVTHAGSWEGYIEGNIFPLSNDQVRVVLDENGNGHITFGEAPPPAAPTDVDHPFDFGALDFQSLPTLEPAERARPWLPFQSLQDDVRARLPLEGFPYTMKAISMDAERIRFSIDEQEVFSQACAAQLPVGTTTTTSGRLLPACMQLDDYLYVTDAGCFHGAKLDDELNITQPGTPVSCSRALLCATFCGCAETSCWPLVGSGIRVDAALDASGDRIEGSLILDGRKNFHLRRSPIGAAGVGEP